MSKSKVGRTLVAQAGRVVIAHFRRSLELHLNGAVALLVGIEDMTAQYIVVWEKRQATDWVAVAVLVQEVGEAGQERALSVTVILFIASLSLVTASSKSDAARESVEEFI